MLQDRVVRERAPAADPQGRSDRQAASSCRPAWRRPRSSTRPSDAAREAGCDDLVLLKCTSTYPATPENTNLATIPDMRERFGCEVGLSDHTMGIGVAVRSRRAGRRVIEKHFTLSRADGGVDSAFSMEPDEMAALVVETERAWQALGHVSYGPTDAEKPSVQFRRSLYVAEDMRAGDVFTPQNLRVVRPGLGLAPKHYDEILGKRIARDAAKGTPLTWDLVESRVSRTVIIAQARMSSTRLPGKTFMDLGGKPVVDRVVERVARARLADDVWIATTTDSSDDVLAEHLDSLGTPCLRGSLDDVLSRYAAAAETSRADTIVRITCDCPLIDPSVIDAVIAAFRDAPEVDYCSNALMRTYPIGMDTEVLSRASLERAARRGDTAARARTRHAVPVSASRAVSPAQRRGSGVGAMAGAATHLGRAGGPRDAACGRGARARAGRVARRARGDRVRSGLGCDELRGPASPRRAKGLALVADSASSGGALIPCLPSQESARANAFSRKGSA